MKNQVKLFILVLSIIYYANADTISNGYFKIFIDDFNGIFTIATDTLHPSGAGKNVLSGGDAGEPLTTYLTVYSKTTDLIYSNLERLENTTFLGEALSITPINLSNEKGFKASYIVDDFDKFTLTSVVAVRGDTYKSSVIVWNVQISNDDAAPMEFGLRLLWDFQIAEDDGPTFATVSPDSGKYQFEKEYKPPTFKAFSLEGNRPLSAYFQLLGEGAGPVSWSHTLTSVPSVPVPVSVSSKISYTSFYETQEVGFFYSPMNGNIATNYTGLNDDSCVYVFFGDSLDNLITLPAGQSYSALSSFTSKNTQTPEQIIENCHDNFTCTYDYINFQDEYSFDCIFLPINQVCNDNNLCTNDFCDPNNYQSEQDTGCVFLEKDCSDQIACTMDQCNTTTGECEHFEIACDDENDCTTDKCDLELGMCTNTPDDAFCQPTEVNLCRNYFCDAEIGCYSVGIVCEDNIHCTVDTCEPSIGCVYTPSNFLCDDNITCTEDICDDSIGKCVNIPRNDYCDDFDGCTTDLCDINNDCQFLPVVCKDAEMQCTQDFCLNGTCIHVALDDKCNDNNNCTIDTCDMILGDCTNIVSDDLCDDDQWCTIDHCDEILGCTYTERNCDDEIACTDDYCDYYTQKCVHSVANETLYCDDKIECTVDFCDLELGRCNHQADNYLCDDNDLCTTDICEKGAMGCVHIEKYCNDQLACTNDTCVAGECVHDPIDDYCNDGVWCTYDECSEEVGRCINNPWHSRCDDNVACTLDICNYTHCLNIPRHEECEDDIPCTINVCQEDGCYLTPDHEVCDDGIDCTFDYCDPDFGCRYILNHTVCADEDNFECTENVCDLQVGCVAIIHNETCNDGIDCSFEYCSKDEGCVRTYRDDYCNDDVGCTVDVCEPGVGCNNYGNDNFCDDGRNCTTEYCDLDYGCVINDTSCAVDEDCEHCINCKAQLTRIVVNDLEDGNYDLLFNTRNIAVEEYTIASPTNGIVDNLLIKGAGQIVLGSEEFLDSEDGLVIGTNSHFRLVPSMEQLPQCNDVTRGYVQIISEWEGIDQVDHMYVCLQSDNSYNWHRVY